MLEDWKDIVFGSDFGGDFLELIEKITDKELTLDLIYATTDLKKYLDNPDLLDSRTDNNVNFTNSEFEQYIHFEDAIIALSAIIVENHQKGEVDLTKAYGSKVLHFRSSHEESKPLLTALQKIYARPEKFVLFELCM